MVNSDGPSRDRAIWWGLASLALLCGQYVFGEYNFRLEEAGHARLVSRTTHYELCVLLQGAAALCGLVAMRRGTAWWILTVIPSVILAAQCLLGDL